jgi:Histidine kinase-, DNA gyrase B-, and HSP90-like ATPase
MTFQVIPQNLSISAMRSSGYRDTAYAIAELIDNSIQSGQGLEDVTEVELICVDKPPTPGARKRLARIAVFDSAGGMDPVTLRHALQFGNGTNLDSRKQKGIGKFGMGLPNSSISQCRRVDVWSWQDDKVYYTYLDVTEIEQGVLQEVPEPVAAVLPSDWLKMISSEIRKHGTLVVWSELDRVVWKQSRTLLRNTEFIAGRIYRHFINNKSVRVRLAAYEEADRKFLNNYESFVRPNDPLYLMRGTNCPSPYDAEPAFEPYGEPEVLRVGFRGTEHHVTIKASVCKREVRRDGGSKPIGQHTRNNLGISVVRADRELELNRSFENSYDPRERWWGIEVAFSPGLDDVFGVTNNKQAATGFMRSNLQDDAEAESMSTIEFQNMLELDQDPRVPMYVISKSIDRLLTGMRAKIAKMRETERVEKAKDTVETEAEVAATKSVSRRRKRIGDTGRSDRQEEEPKKEREAALSSEFKGEGIEENKAQEIAVEYVSKAIKFRFQHGSFSGHSFFDVASTGGLILITLNTRSPVHGALFQSMQEEEQPQDFHSKEMLSLLAAWGRMEDEAQSKQILQSMQDLRETWGRIAMDFFEPGQD